ncbi:MAG: CapA family protein [Ornithinimicrobium sp.]|uniref:CapA family protein n=1 Tax=Ornithinimicrobium sp. TaxID=1977084 RepID=UPI0026DFF3D7|nr:CapA family protein [Ornithinimicrobium sp.]MDO5739342.1 CapA family protein [Ornithinimicrobium sp.]
MRRWAAGAAITLMAPLALTACGFFGSDDAGTGSTPESPTSSEAAQTGEQDTGQTSDQASSGGGSVASPDDAKAPAEVTIAAIGDILAHSRLNLTANEYAGYAEGKYNYDPMFADVAPLISSADLSLCHMETPLSPDNTNLSIPDILSFNTPHEMATALAKAGIDGCDFASNHTMDRGIDGLADTEQVIRDAGLGYAGPSAHEDRAGKAEFYDVKGVTVAHLAYTYTFPNSGGPTTDIPGEAPWLIDASWPSIGSEGILQQSAKAKAEGADFVVVSMHWGGEYQAAPLDEQLQIADDLLSSDDVDLILGTHVHVIQPCQRINGKDVIYGLGNFLSNQSPDTASVLLPATQEGMVAIFTLKRDADGVVTTEMSYQPTRVEITPGTKPGPHIVRLVGPDNYPQTWERTTATVDLLGGCDQLVLQP